MRLAIQGTNSKFEVTAPISKFRTSSPS